VEFNMNTKRKCLFCGNPTYDSKKWYCSIRCKRRVKKLRRLKKLYFNDKTRKWELINYANNQ
jgi:predicted nucleic acid-binding Zn ribbon protein